MGIFRAVVPILLSPMFDTRKHFGLRRAVAPQFVSDDHKRHILQALLEFAEELLGGLLVPPALYQDLQHVPVLIHGPP